MPEQLIENIIVEMLTGEAQKNALAFVAYLRANEMQFYRDKNGYWEDKLYWWIKYKEEYFCFILINGYEDGHWVIWFEDGGSDCYANFPVAERVKEIAWANVDIFKGNCGGGQCEGLRKVIFGKEFESLYRTLMCFDNPNTDAVECMETLVNIRKADIDFAKITACGECCFGCKKKDDGLCEGCIESDGQCKEWAESKGCPIYKCAKQHEVQFCGICPAFPCDWLARKVTWNPNIVDDLTELAMKYRRYYNGI